MPSPNNWITREFPTGIILNLTCSVQLLSHVQLFVTPWTAASQASLSITNSQSLLKLTSVKSVMPSNHLILCHPLCSHLQSFPASGSFPMSQFFTSGGKVLGVSASASVLPMNAMLCYAKSLQSCPCLCDPIDGCPPGSSIPGILQARTLEWAAISFSRKDLLLLPSIFSSIRVFSNESALRIR